MILPITIGLLILSLFFTIGLTREKNCGILKNKRRALLSLPREDLVRIEMLFQKVVKSGQVT